MKLFDSSGKVYETDELFKPKGPIDKDFLERLKDLCPGADVILQSDDATLCVTFKNIAEVSGIKRNMICGADLYFNQTDGKYSGFGSYYCPEDKYVSGEYAVFYNNGSESLPQAVLRYFPEMRTFIGFLNSMETGDTKSVLRNRLLIDRTLSDVDKTVLWEIYKKIKSQSTNAHYKKNMIYFRLKEGIEGTVRICRDGRLENNGRFFKTAEIFLNAFRNGIVFDQMAYGNDPVFMEAALKGETL